MNLSSKQLGFTGYTHLTLPPRRLKHHCSGLTEWCMPWAPQAGQVYDRDRKHHLRDKSKLDIFCQKKLALGAFNKFIRWRTVFNFDRFVGSMAAEGFKWNCFWAKAGGRSGKNCCTDPTINCTRSCKNRCVCVCVRFPVDFLPQWDMNHTGSSLIEEQISELINVASVADQILDPNLRFQGHCYSVQPQSMLVLSGIRQLTVQECTLMGGTWWHKG